MKAASQLKLWNLNMDMEFSFKHVVQEFLQTY